MRRMQITVFWVTTAIASLGFAQSNQTLFSLTIPVSKLISVQCQANQKECRMDTLSSTSTSRPIANGLLNLILPSDFPVVYRPPRPCYCGPTPGGSPRPGIQLIFLKDQIDEIKKDVPKFDLTTSFDLIDIGQGGEAGAVFSLGRNGPEMRFQGEVRLVGGKSIAESYIVVFRGRNPAGKPFFEFYKVVSP